MIGSLGESSVHVKNKLNVLRAERGFSKAGLAEELCVARQTVHAIATAKLDPSLPLDFKLAAVFGKAIEDLFEPSKEDLTRVNFL